MNQQLVDIRHDYIRYANCWEDTSVLLRALNVKPGSRVISIASGGDNSLSLLTTGPQCVIAVDLNQTQLYVTALKKAAIQQLEYDEFLAFLGFTQCLNRLTIYERIKNILPDDAQTYFNANKKLIKNGIIYCGKFERYFLFFSRWLLPLIHNKTRINELFRSKPQEAQSEFYNRNWNSRRWRFFFRLFFSRWVLGRFGRDPRFLKEVKVPVGDFIFNQAKHHLSSVHCQTNPFLQFILAGKFITLPHYARRENFMVIKKNCQVLVTYHGTIEQALEKFGKMDAFNLSNIFEYMNTEVFSFSVKKLADYAKPSARAVYWNLMVHRSMHQVVTQWIPLPVEEEERRRDYGFFYSGFFVNRYEE